MATSILEQVVAGEAPDIQRLKGNVIVAELMAGKKLEISVRDVIP